MKRQRGLIHQIADPDNLRLAFYKAQKGKSGKAEVRKFVSNLDENLLDLREHILSGNVETGNYHYFTIYDPKERLICAASFPERVLHHALMNICHPVFEKYQIFDSYASRKDKGTYKALERAKTFQRQNRWYLKLDVRKYFDSIDHLILMKTLEKKFKDATLLNIFQKIINSYETEESKGLPIGNLTSQYFANHYLAVTDHFIKQELKVKNYVRYMDDMVLWSDDNKKLQETGKIVQDYLSGKSKLRLKTFCLNKSEYGITFLGYRVYGDHLQLAKRSRIRFVKKLKSYYEFLDNGKFSQFQFHDHVIPLLSFTKHARSYNFRKKTVEQIYGQWPWARIV